MPEYTITELAELTAISRRNIYFYIQQDLLPPALGAGMAARYTEEHAARLRAIPRLRAQGMRLDEIRTRLAGLSAAEIERVLTQPKPPQPLQPPGMAPPPGPPWPRAQSVTRYTLAPGVELLVSADASPPARALAEQILRQRPPTDPYSPDPSATR